MPCLFVVGIRTNENRCRVLQPVLQPVLPLCHGLLPRQPVLKRPMYGYIYICVCVCVCVCVFVCVCMYIRMYVCMYVCILYIYNKSTWALIFETLCQDAPPASVMLALGVSIAVRRLLVCMCV